MRRVKSANGYWFSEDTTISPSLTISASQSMIVRPTMSRPETEDSQDFPLFYYIGSSQVQKENPHAPKYDLLHLKDSLASWHNSWD